MPSRLNASSAPYPFPLVPDALVTRRGIVTTLLRRRLEGLATRHAKCTLPVMQSVSQRGDPGPSLIRDRTRHQPSWGDTIGATLSTAKCRGAVAPALQAAAKCLRLLWLGKAMDCRSNLRHGQCGAEQSADYFSKIDRSASWSSDLAGLSECAQTLKSSRKYLSLVSRLPLSCAACAAPYSERNRRGSFLSVASNCCNACVGSFICSNISPSNSRAGESGPGVTALFSVPSSNCRCRFHLPQCFFFLTHR